MRTSAGVAFAFLGVAALGAIPDTLTCTQSPLGYCDLLWSVLLFFLGFCGLALALISSIWGIVRTVKRRQWLWLLGLVTGLLVPLPAGVALSVFIEVVFGYGSTAVQTFLPISAGLLLTPVVAFVYSSKYEAASEVWVDPTRYTSWHGD